MATIYLCDDNRVLRQKYGAVIRSLGEANGENIELKEFSGGSEILAYAKTHPDEADVIYMDIIMTGVNGVETVRELRRRGCNAEVVFLTSCEEYVFESFETYPARYVIKSSVTKEDFEKVLMTAVTRAKRRKAESVTVDDENGRPSKVLLADIIYLEQETGRLKIFCADRALFSGESLMEIEKQLTAKHFARIDESFLINLSAVDKMESGKVVLSADVVLNVAPEYEDNLKISFSEYLTEQF